MMGRAWDVHVGSESSDAAESKPWDLASLCMHMLELVSVPVNRNSASASGSTEIS
jgi:hypothetical protein